MSVRGGEWTVMIGAETTLAGIKPGGALCAFVMVGVLVLVGTGEVDAERRSVVAEGEGPRELPGRLIFRPRT